MNHFILVMSSLWLSMDVRAFKFPIHRVEADTQKKEAAGSLLDRAVEGEQYTWSEIIDSCVYVAGSSVAGAGNGVSVDWA